MYWVKLTQPTGDPVWVNLDRFDKILIATAEEEPHRHVTTLMATLSDTEDDYASIDVMEKPDEFLPAMES